MRSSVFRNSSTTDNSKKLFKIMHGGKRSESGLARLLKRRLLNQSMLDSNKNPEKLQRTQKYINPLNRDKLGVTSS